MRSTYGHVCWDITRTLIITTALWMIAGKMYTGAFLWNVQEINGVEDILHSINELRLSARDAIDLYFVEDPSTRVLSLKELASYGTEEFEGPDTHGRLYLSVCNQVFDVTRRPDLYGTSGPYSRFTGRDATLAFLDLNFAESSLNRENRIHAQHIDLYRDALGHRAATFTAPSEKQHSASEDPQSIEPASGDQPAVITAAVHRNPTDPPEPSQTGLSKSEVAGMLQWLDFYMGNPHYYFVGQLVDENARDWSHIVQIWKHNRGQG